MDSSLDQYPPFQQIMHWLQIALRHPDFIRVSHFEPSLTSRLLTVVD